MRQPWQKLKKIELEAKRLKDLKVKNYLFQAIDRPILETIPSKKTSKDIWDSMKKKYQGSEEWSMHSFKPSEENSRLSKWKMENLLQATVVRLWR